MSSPQEPRPVTGPAADADPPTEVVDDLPATDAPPREPEGEPESAGPEALHDADPPTAVEPGEAEPPSDVEPEEAEQPDPGAEPTASEPVAEPAAESGALHDADPPTEALPPAVGDAPVEPPEQAGEPESAGPGELHDADPPTEPEGEEVESDELPRLGDEELEKALEALLLVVDSPVEEDVLANAVGAELVRVTETLGRMATTLAEHERGFDLRRAGGGWRFYTRDKYAPYVEKMLLDGQRAKLTRAALETLAVIAYRQPVTRARVAAVRGVNCDGVIRTLLARGLVEETGTDVETGGFLYRTTELFLERLGLSSLEDLPPIAPLLPEVDAIDDV
ncbi:SMC-Scp complex subunit ScpB [Actinophytocola sp.]|uniref:SMC-Scp complex subunit ScpB n=1 Tax=Actinophytocola sp. TaxID=1872138 RepID=UPI0039C8925A